MHNQAVVFVISQIIRNNFTKSFREKPFVNIPDRVVNIFFGSRNASLAVAVVGSHLSVYCIIVYCIIVYCILYYCILYYCILYYCVLYYCVLYYCILYYCIIVLLYYCVVVLLL